jgi:hypothetical protein
VQPESTQWQHCARNKVAVANQVVQARLSALPILTLELLLRKAMRVQCAPKA